MIRAVLLAAALLLAPPAARAANLVVWWEKGYNSEEDAAVREIVATFEHKTGKRVDLAFHSENDLPGRTAAAVEARWGLAGSRPSDPCSLGLYKSATVAHNLLLNTRPWHESLGGAVADARDFGRKTCATAAEGPPRTAPPAEGRGGLVAEMETRWVVRLRAPAGRRLDDLLRLGLSIDVWQRQDDAFVAVVSDKTLRELERRRLADVERIGTTAEYEEHARKLSQP
jgi:hypothetical protein